MIKHLLARLICPATKWLATALNGSGFGRIFFLGRPGLHDEIVERISNTMRVIITLACGECKRRNYVTTKNKKTTPDRLEQNKYCRFCRSVHAHKETK